jgi:hypothetical protein
MKRPFLPSPSVLHGSYLGLSFDRGRSSAGRRGALDGTTAMQPSRC